MDGADTLKRLFELIFPALTEDVYALYVYLFRECTFSNAQYSPLWVPPFVVRIRLTGSRFYRDCRQAYDRPNLPTSRRK